MLQNETVRACLPHLGEDMLERAVQVYREIYQKKFGYKKFHKLLKHMGVVAFRLGNASACTQVSDRDQPVSLCMHVLLTILTLPMPILH